MRLRAIHPLKLSSQGGPVSSLAGPSSATLPLQNAAPIAPTFPLYSSSCHATRRLAYIRNPAEADAEISKLSGGPLGFDLEWKPNYIKGNPENPVSLVQLANKNTVLLIQVSAMREFPQRLREVLESPTIIKAGAGIQNDTKKLWRDHGVSTRNCVDLSLLARSVDNARWKGKYNSPLGLARLVETYERLSLPKGKITRSNWEALLNDRQQEYAANDAHSGFVLHARLTTMAENMLKPPETSCYTFDLVHGHLLHPTGAIWHPENPDYDPGPPPPPRAPKPPKTPGADNQSSAVIASNPKAPTGVVSSKSTRPPHRKYAKTLPRSQLDKSRGGSASAGGRERLHLTGASNRVQQSVSSQIT